MVGLPAHGVVIAVSGTIFQELRSFGSVTSISLLKEEGIGTLGVYIGGALMALQSITSGDQSCQGDKYCQTQGRFKIHDFA